MRNNRFQVQLQFISSTNGQSSTNGTFTGLEILQRQALDMIQCQQAREKYYPKFEKSAQITFFKAFNIDIFQFDKHIFIKVYTIIKF